MLKIIRLIVLILLSLTVKAENNSDEIINSRHHANKTDYKNLDFLDVLSILTNQSNIFKSEDGFSGNPVQIIDQRQKKFHSLGSPLFACDIFTGISTKTRNQLLKFNADQSEIIELEKKIIDVINPYVTWLSEYYRTFLELGDEAPFGFSNNVRMLNDMGGAIPHHCSLTNYNFIPYLLFYFSPKNTSTVLDLGSGWGACTKELALLGYKVYSIDIDKRHLDFQKNNFCTAPDNHTFLYNHWKLYNSELITEKKHFSRHCDNSYNNVKYILGDFSQNILIDKIQNNSIDIILLMDSIQFVPSIKERSNILYSLDKKLKKGGVLFIKAPTFYDFNINKEVLENPIFSNYKAIMATSLKEVNTTERHDQLHVLALQKNNSKNKYSHDL